MKEDTRKTVQYHKDVFKWIKTIQKRHGFNFSQAVNFALTEAMRDNYKKHRDAQG